jgi:iron complex outermembrane recepter protein
MTAFKRAYSDVLNIRDMKKTTTLFLLVATLSANAWSQQVNRQQNPNTLDTQKTNVTLPANYPIIEEIPGIEQVIIKAFQLGKNQDHPAFETVKAKDLQLRNLGQDIPMLLQHQTGIVSTSDAGNGIGYTGIRMRGSDATRTHISVNGVPINDAESQGTFWVNMPDLASSAQNIHIQRGVGSSVHGAGAFGGGIMIQTGNNLYNKAELDLAYGSFNTRKITAKYYSPIINFADKNWTYDLRISHIGSNGFINRSNTELYGYMASLQSQSQKGWNHKFMVFGGAEKTAQAWWGIPIEKYNMGNPNPTAADSQALSDHYFRNIGTYRNNQDSLNLFNSNPNQYNYYLFPNETDNYQQHHFHYYSSKNINSQLNINNTVYYTYGSGYFEQFRFQDELSYYGLPPRISGTDTNNIANLVRQRWLQNHLIGVNTHINWRINNTNQLLSGFGASRYLGQHFGRVISVGNPINDVEIIEPSTDITTSLPIEYYRSSGNKTDINAFAKYMYTSQALTGLSAFADAQIRYVRHDGVGTDNDLKNIDFLGEFLFFNPKAGVNFNQNHRNANSNYQASVSVSNREPARSDFVDNVAGNIPKPERLIDYELGYTYTHKNASQIKINAYYMDYYNQLVLTGALNDVGAPLRQNVDRSYRAGIEIGTQLPVIQEQNHTLRLIANGAFSQNRIAESPASWIDYLDFSTFDTVYKNAPIAYSPDIVASAGFHYEFRKNSQTYELQYLQKYVSQQFLDNTGDQGRSIPSYTFSELQLAYYGPLSDQRSIQVKLQVQNIFNNRYLNNGYTWGYRYDRQLTQEIFVFPSAPTNFTLAVSMLF